MRIRFATICAVLCLFLPSFAMAQQLAIGGRAQAGFINLNSDDASADEGIDGQFGFGLGGVLIWSPSDNYGAQVEAGWVRRGALSTLRLFEIQGASTGAELDVTLDYLEVPLLLRLQYVTSEFSAVPKLLLGPYVAGFLGGTARATAFGLSIEGDLEAGDDIDPFDAGFVIGGGADVPVGSDLIITSDVRFQHGVVGIQANDGDSSVYNLAVTFNLGVAYGL